MRKLYNEEMKMAFIDSHDNNNTRKTIRHILLTSAATERSLGKDLYDFSLAEIKTVLYDANASTKLSIKTHGRHISLYLDWAISMGYRKNMNPLMGMLDSWYDQFPMNKKVFYSEDEILAIEKQLVNSQDVVAIRLAFLGVNMSELLNLKDENIFPVSRRLTLFDGERSRTITVDKETMEIIQKALSEDEYHFKNGKSMGKKRVGKLEKNNYLIRPVADGRPPLPGRADKMVVYRRLNPIIKKVGYRYFTYGNVVRSGRLKWVKDNYHAFGAINSKLLNALAKHFEFSKILNNGIPSYNIHRLKQYITEENVEALYPEVESYRRRD